MSDNEDRPPVPEGFHRFEVKVACHIFYPGQVSAWSEHRPNYTDARIGSEFAQFVGDPIRHEWKYEGHGGSVITMHKLYRENTRPFDITKDLTGSVTFVTRWGRPMRWRKNGQTKLWKTRPGEFRIPVKYGLYDHTYITHEDVGLYEVEL